MNSSLTRYAFMAGALYFCCMAAAHFFGLKYPLLFVYYDTPFYGYQDKIISFAVLAYVALFYQAARRRDAVLTALVVMGVTILGLSSVNLSEALAEVLTSGQSTMPYWIQVALFAGYWLALFGLWRRDGSHN
ncbi:hypothetical protein [Parasedimentitalea maritima]|uniref:Uncharacterized protein n=1 Tax=Parasedimentitalea maritima TaxID=2578117 RepID=A0A6A4RRC4_9RHOB|nr:hypothetical protein [Zongyanglinia marina]KAE9632744.1 hypothetical protein GP644_02930 [Zongyanglinia marina]